jgi:(2R)-3-sulfolactate dehydrogenase (NADP+)
MAYYSFSELQRLAIQALTNHNISHKNAISVTKALLKAESDGIRTHGLSRLQAYCDQAVVSKVFGQVVPKVEQLAPAVIRVDAGFGFAYPAIDLAVETIAPIAEKMGIAMASIYRSHHFGVAGHSVESLAADHNLVAMMFGNAPKSIAPWGGKEPLFGTNPIAFSAPRENKLPLVIDMSLSKVARGKVMLAQQQGKEIPDDWALDKEGNSTTDPNQAMDGTMLPLGEAKGAALVLMVEILSACLTGANFSYEASSFFNAEGDPPGVGQLMIVINPRLFGGEGFSNRLEELFRNYLAQENTRLPADRRYQLRTQSQEKGIEVADKLYQQVQLLASES